MKKWWWQVTFWYFHIFLNVFIFENQCSCFERNHCYLRYSFLVVGTESMVNFVHQCEDQSSSGSGGGPPSYAWIGIVYACSEAAPHNVPFHSQKSPVVDKKLYVIILDFNSFVSFYLLRFLHVPASLKTRRCYWLKNKLLPVHPDVPSPHNHVAIISFPNFCLFLI